MSVTKPHANPSPAGSFSSLQDAVGADLDPRNDLKAQTQDLAQGAPTPAPASNSVKPSTLLAFASLGFGKKPRTAPRYTNEPQAVMNAAERAPGLGSLMATAQRNQKRLTLLKGVVPPIILTQLSAGNLEQGVWCLMLKSPAAAGKLRQLVPAMCAHLRTKGELVHDITVKVIQHQG